MILPAATLAGEDHKSGEIVAIAAQAIGRPRSHARPAGDGRAGVHEGVGGVVVDGFGGHRADDADVIRDGAEIRKKLDNLLAILAKFLELLLRSKAFELLALKLGDGLALGEAFRHRFSAHLSRVWLVVEGFEMRHSARHAEPDNPLGFLREMQRIDDAGVATSCRARLQPAMVAALRGAIARD